MNLDIVTTSEPLDVDLALYLKNGSHASTMDLNLSRTLDLTGSCLEKLNLELDLGHELLTLTCTSDLDPGTGPWT